LEYNLCKEYPAMTPFELENTSFFEVIDLFIDTKKMQMRIEEIQQEPKKEKVIRRKAGDDWF
jgi:hypothetical protein